MQRRSFLQWCAMTALAGKSSAAALNQQAAKPIKVGQIGTKHAHAAGQLQTVRNAPELFEVVGIVEPDEKRYQQVANTLPYEGVPRLELEELLAIPELKIVAVETEVRDLLSVAKRCLQAGKHIHLDKPAGESLTELQEIHEIARSKKLTIQMGYMFRYNPAFQFLFQAVKDGWLGEILEIHGVINSNLSAELRGVLAEYPGGSMYELGCHLIDPLIYLMGEPEKITPFRRMTSPEEQLYDNMLAVFEYPKATATIRSCLNEIEAGKRRQFVVAGTAGTIAIQPLEPPTLTLTLKAPQGDFKAGTQQMTFPRAGRYQGAWEELAAVVNGQKVFPFSLEHDYQVQKAILKASAQ